jgi:hypothetical protein
MKRKKEKKSVISQCKYSKCLKTFTKQSTNQLYCSKKCQKKDNYNKNKVIKPKTITTPKPKTIRPNRNMINLTCKNEHTFRCNPYNFIDKCPVCSEPFEINNQEMNLILSNYFKSRKCFYRYCNEEPTNLIFYDSGVSVPYCSHHLKLIMSKREDKKEYNHFNILKLNACGVIK